MDKEYFKEIFDSQDSLPANLQDCDFENCSFLNIDFKTYALSRSKFIDCTFKFCDLSNVKMNSARMIAPHFEDCKLIGIDWTLLEVYQNPTFVMCMMSFSNFTGLKLKKVIFKDCILQDADFLQADMSESVFSGSDLINARFEETNLISSNFTKAFNYKISPVTNKIRSAKFSLSEAVGLLSGFDIILE